MSEVTLGQFEATLADLVQFFGVSRQTIHRWGIKPLRKEGRFFVYDLRAAVRLKYESDENLDLGRERALLARAQREKLELEQAVRCGDLLSAPLVVRAWTFVLAEFRSRVEPTIGAIDTAIASAEIKKELGERLVADLRDGVEALATFDVVALMPTESDEDRAANGTDTGDEEHRPMGRRKSQSKQGRKRKGRTVAH